MNESEIYVKSIVLHVRFTRISCDKQNMHLKWVSHFSTIIRAHRFDVSVPSGQLTRNFPIIKSFFEQRSILTVANCVNALKMSNSNDPQLHFTCCNAAKKPKAFCVLIFSCSQLNSNCHSGCDWAIA
jgi:hypothetical protein